MPTVILLGLILSLSVSAVSGQVDSEDAESQPYFKSTHAGVRLGGWANLGDTPQDSFNLSSGGFYRNDIGDGSFYLEGHLGYWLSRSLMLEISLGVASRGDVILDEADGGSSIGSMQIYPILAKLKLYPLGTRTRKWHPYLLAGGGFYYGRHDIQLTTGLDAYLRQIYGEDSETKVSYMVGGGVDWSVASMVALDLNAQYLPARFSGKLIGIKDYSALTITVGVKYLMKSKNKDNRYHKLHSRRGR